MYFVVNLCECEIIAGCSSISNASIILENTVRESDGFYTEDDFAIMDEEAIQEYLNECDDEDELENDY